MRYMVVIEKGESSWGTHVPDCVAVGETEQEVKHLMQEAIEFHLDNLNNRPRKTLGYKSPNEVYFKELEQLTRVALTA